MTRFIVLDSTPVGLLVHARPELRTRVEAWMGDLISSSVVVLPEIVLYEVRRELVRLGAGRSIRLLDGLPGQMLYARLTTSILVHASELWAEGRRTGRPSAGPRELDIDVILAATALDLAATSDDEVIVATSNVGHLALCVDAREWQSITP